MGRALRLFPTAAAASRALAELPGSEFVAGDLCRGWLGFAVELALGRRFFRLPTEIERLALAREAAAHAQQPLALPACAAFARALSELHGSGLQPPQLLQVAIKLRDGPLAEQARRLAAALKWHQQLLESRSLVDLGAVFWLARAAVSEGCPLPFDRIEVAPKLDWTQGELGLLHSVAQRLPLGAVTVTLPGTLGERELFAELEPVWLELVCEGLIRVEVLKEGALAARLYVARSDEGRDQIVTASFGSPEAEARAIANRVRELLRTGHAPDRIAVTSFGPLSPALPAALSAAEVPVGGALVPLGQRRAGQAALLVLAACEEGVPRERLCELIESRLLAVSARWAGLLREAGSGDHRAGRLLPPLRALLTSPRDGRWEPPAIAELESAVAVLAALPDRATVAEHAAALWRALSALGVLSRLGERSVGRRPPADQRAANSGRGGRRRALPGQLTLFVTPDERSATPPSLLATALSEAPTWVQVASAEAAADLQALEANLSALVALADDAGSASLALLSRTEFAGLLRLALDRTPGPRVRPLPNGVALAPIGQLAGQTFDEVLLSGLSGTTGPASDDVFLPESLRRMARDVHERPFLFAPSGPAAARQRERTALWLACNSATDRLWASGARSLAGKPQEPSPLLLELARLSARGLVVVPYEPWPGAGPRVLTREELCAAAVGLDPATAAAVWQAEPKRSASFAELQRIARERDLAILEARPHAHSGDLSAPDLTAPLGKALAFDSLRPLSASTLDRLAGCGFRALATTVYQLRSPDERNEELDLRDRGTLLHACLEAAFLALQAAGLTPPCGLPAELEVFQRAVRAELQRWESRQAVGHPVVWGAARRGLERQLASVLAQVQAAVDGYVPTDFELQLRAATPDRPLGPRERPAPSLSLRSGPIVLGGRIDRIDRKPGALRVIDYKSGRVEAKNERIVREFGGRELQLAHYALAFRLLEPEVEVDAAYASIRDAKHSKTLSEAAAEHGVALDAFLATDPAARDLASAQGSPNLANRIEGLLHSARGGVFPVAPGDCAFCEFATACRVGERYREWE